MESWPDVESCLADLREVSFDQLRAHVKTLEPYREAVLRQVERPRVNLGSGPPGRAD